MSNELQWKPRHRGEGEYADIGDGLGRYIVTSRRSIHRGAEAGEAGVDAVNRQLWDHQAQALTALRQSIGQGVKRIVLAAPTGAGKTLLAAAIVEGAQSKGNRLAFVVPSIQLIDQTVEKFYAEGIRDIGVIQANHEMTDWSRSVQVCSVQTLKSRQAYPEAKIVVFDECVKRGTKIATPVGEKNIEDVRVSDCVFNASGVGTVKAISHRRRPIVKMELSNGRELGVTKWHPVFGEQGWRFAGSVAKRSLLFSQQAVSALWNRISSQGWRDRKEMERSGVLFGGLRPYESVLMASMGIQESTEILQGMRRCDAAMGRWEERQHTGREIVERSRMLLAILFEEIQESDAFSGYARETKRNNVEDWPSTDYSRWQWEAVTKATSAATGNIGVRMGGGNGNLYKDEARFWISALLQSGHSKFETEDRDRGRWGVSCWPQEGIRQEEGSALGDVRVENISGEECGSAEDVFNLHVSGHPSYFAEGVLVHNCHALHKFHADWLMHPDWQNVPFIGLSATPYTKGLGRYFHSLLIAATTKELIDKGLLSPFTVYACPKADLKDVKVVAGDYVKDQLSSAMQNGTLTADIVKTWQERWGKDKTLVFAVDRAHAETLHFRFIDAGVRSAYQDANTSSADRHEIERGFHDGRYQVVCNIGTLTQGVDWDVRCLVLARPTRSESLYVQILGRALRTAPGKDRALILDHSDTTQELGLVTDIHHDHLDSGKKQTAREIAEKPRKPLPRACPQCASIQPRLNRVCQQCGFKLPLMSGVTERDGILVEFVPGKVTKGVKREYTYLEKMRFFAELRGFADEHDKSFKWVLANYRHKFNGWPDRSWENCVTAIEPSFELTSWIKSRQIAWAKSRRKQEMENAGAVR